MIFNNSNSELNSELMRNNSEINFEKMREMRRNALGFDPQKEIIYNKYLPYAQQLDEECVRHLSQIKVVGF